MEGWDIRRRLERIENDVVRLELKTDAQSKLLAQLWKLLTGADYPDDLQLQIGGNKMAKGTTVTCKLYPKGHKLGAVMQPVTLKPTDTAINFVVVDGNGNPIPTTDPTKVTTTCDDASNPALVITAGADSLHWGFTIPANTPPTPVPVTAGLTYNDGSAGPFSASIQLTTPTPPPPVPMDLDLTIS